MSDCEKKSTDAVDTERADIEREDIEPSDTQRSGTQRLTTELEGNYTLDFGDDLTYHQYGPDFAYFCYTDAEGNRHVVPALGNANTPALEAALRRVMAEVRELRAQVKDLQPPF